ncbi:AbrB family transcriptional regulator [Paracoccus sp. Z118]|uniref:AbrB family transcriptional regulator n=1 Tax=Paracoccus sp. Z118 TaxID=2851017 RepID=UPI00353026B1
MAPAPIIMAQTLRISAIVVILPLLLYAIDGRPAPVEFAGTGGGPVGILLLALAALAGGAVFRALNWVNPFFLGPLAASSALTAAGVPLTPFPDAVLSAGQIVLGAWLGSTFQRKLFEGAGREMLVSIAGTLLLLALSTAGAVAVARLTGLPWETLILATAPGGVTEMALTARYLQQSVSFVTAAHVVRIFLLMPVARPLVRAIDRRG